ncbi:PadR family transcriptional regulator [Niallia sp. JL1B1071]|uniref:PadR family transcriptional regulator n=1 Tax=Niallia tiangongensis TaxID=3237105 RepID=UPI0037DCAF71
MSKSQMLKGILEGCLLAIISKGEIYGYEMIEKLQAYGFTMISEGSIYPVLLRMKKEELVTVVETKASPSGPKRKYYSLTAKGHNVLDEFADTWTELATSVHCLLKDIKEEM